MALIHRFLLSSLVNSYWTWRENPFLRYICPPRILSVGTSLGCFVSYGTILVYYMLPSICAFFVFLDFFFPEILQPIYCYLETWWR